jgi:hypothetical protein
MTKACDRVEWNFLDDDGQPGFNENWIDLIVNCMTIVRYHIKINDELSEEISPQWGLRQDDPISPIFSCCVAWNFLCWLCLDAHVFISIYMCWSGIKLNSIIVHSNTYGLNWINMHQTRLFWETEKRLTLSDGINWWGEVAYELEMDQEAGSVCVAGSLLSGDKAVVLFFFWLRQGSGPGPRKFVTTCLRQAKFEFFEFFSHVGWV